jgi:hypothetical protein
LLADATRIQSFVKSNACLRTVQRLRQFGKALVVALTRDLRTDLVADVVTHFKEGVKGTMRFEIMSRKLVECALPQQGDFIEQIL